MADPVIGGLAAALSPICGALVLLEGEPSVQAKAANDFGAHVYLGVEHSRATTVEVDYFSVPGFESVGGRALAELVIRELPAGPQWGLGVARGMRLPILRETRAPAVQVKLTDAGAAAQHRDLLVNALERALERWATEPLGAH
jgi:N-acetylmuramoyl-L-alanine amidase